jgi:hypothetical protein
MSSVLGEARPDALMHSQLDEWRKQAIQTVFADESKLVYSLVQSYKHMVLGGLHSFHLYVTGNLDFEMPTILSYFSDQVQVCGFQESI